MTMHYTKAELKFLEKSRTEREAKDSRLFAEPEPLDLGPPHEPWRPRLVTRDDQ